MTLYGEPTPKQSGRMQAFFEQRPLDLFAPGSEEIIHVHGENLFVLWDFDFAAKRIGSVELVKPDVWCLAIPYPEVTVVDLTLTDVDDLEDLELEREDDALNLPDLELAKKKED